MRILFTPQFRNDALTLSKAGDALIINGEGFDLSSIPDGGTIELGGVPCGFINGPIDRIDGELSVPLVLPFSEMPEGKVATAPDPITVTEDGPITLPEVVYVDA